MKYTLQVNQIAAHGIGIQDKIDLIDLCLFDAFKSFANSARCEKMIDDNGIWFWISYAEIIRELPLANIKTKDGIYRRMLKLRDAGLIVFHPNNQKAAKTFFQWGKNYDAMERTDWEEQPTDKKPKVVKDLRMKNRSTYGQETVAPTDEKPYNQTTINQTTKTKGERTTPAPNPSNLQSQKNKSGLVAPAENPETLEAETPPSKKVAPKKDSPGEVEEKNEFEFCNICQGKKMVWGRSGWEHCPTCDGSGFANNCFHVTAIASPTELPGVTLVEPAPRPLRYDEYPNPRNANELKDRLKEYFTHHPEDWRLLIENAKVNWMPEKLEETTLAYCLHQEKEGNMKRTYNTYKAGLTTWFMRQKSWDAQNNAPKEGGQTRQNPPANYTSSTRH